MPFIECLVFLLIWLPLGSFGLKIFIIKNLLQYYFNYHSLATFYDLSCISHEMVKTLSWNQSLMLFLFLQDVCLVDRHIQVYELKRRRRAEDMTHISSLLASFTFPTWWCTSTQAHTALCCWKVLRDADFSPALFGANCTFLHLLKRVRCWMCLMSAETVTGPS